MAALTPHARSEPLFRIYDLTDIMPLNQDPKNFALVVKDISTGRWDILLSEGSMFVMKILFMQAGQIRFVKQVDKLDYENKIINGSFEEVCQFLLNYEIVERPASESQPIPVTQEAQWNDLDQATFLMTAYLASQLNPETLPDGIARARQVLMDHMLDRLPDGRYEARLKIEEIDERRNPEDVQQ